MIIDPSKHKEAVMSNGGYPQESGGWKTIAILVAGLVIIVVIGIVCDK